MTSIRNPFGAAGWILAIPAVWAFGASDASAQRIPLRGPPAVNRQGIFVGQDIFGPFVVVSNLNSTSLSAGGIQTTFISGHVVPVAFGGFASQAALLPGAIPPPALNNGSLQRNAGNIAAGALGDGLLQNGIIADPDFIFTALGNNNMNNNGNIGQPGQPGQPIVGAVRAARFRAMLADQASQANWNYMNAVRVSMLAGASQTQTPAFAYGPAFTTKNSLTLPYGPAFTPTNSLTNKFGKSALGDTGAAFNGFARDADSSETTLTSDGSASATPSDEASSAKKTDSASSAKP